VQYVSSQLLVPTAFSAVRWVAASLNVSLKGDGPMQTIERPPEFSHDRRRFLGVAALSLAAMQLGPIGPAKAQGGPAKPARPAAIKPGTNTSFAALKQIDAGPLNVGYAEAGPADGPPVPLLHGWPYDIHSYVDVAPSSVTTSGPAISHFRSPPGQPWLLCECAAIGAAKPAL
jgi:hypothetical protein